jgi:hypothetical protein
VVDIGEMGRLVGRLPDRDDPGIRRAEQHEEEQGHPPELDLAHRVPMIEEMPGGDPCLRCG